MTGVGKIVLGVGVYDTADILADHLDWYLHRGVDFIVALDYGSTDGSRDILDQFKRAGVLEWRPNPDHNYTRNNPFDAVAAIARDEFAADWIIVCDTDEFLVTDDLSLRDLIAAGSHNGFSVISIPCFNMTGPAPHHGSRAIEQLTLRIDRPLVPDSYREQGDDLPAPYIFFRHPPKTIMRAETLIAYEAGSHTAQSTSGSTGTVLGSRFLHYQMRSYETFERKIRNTARWLRENPELAPWFAWHWRRWVQQYEAGELRAEHARQFVTPQQAEVLVQDRICSHDPTIASWAAAHSTRSAAARGGADGADAR